MVTKMESSHFYLIPDSWNPVFTNIVSDLIRKLTLCCSIFIILDGKYTYPVMHSS